MESSYESIWGMASLPKDFLRHSNSALLGVCVTRAAQTYSNMSNMGTFPKVPSFSY